MCIAAFDKQFNLAYSIVDMHWTGKKSLWIYHPAIIKQEDRYQRELHFRPWLELNAGEYTCHVVIRTADNHIHVINKTIEVKSKHIIFSLLHAVVSVLCVFRAECQCNYKMCSQCRRIKFNCTMLQDQVQLHYNKAVIV